ncbi:MAG TPA: RNA pseudouridine synthase, partial [Cellulomonas sp.]
MAELRALPVPDGLAGERVDAGIARLLGLSRTRAADLAAAGRVRLDGRTMGKSDRLMPGGWL